MQNTISVLYQTLLQSIAMKNLDTEYRKYSNVRSNGIASHTFSNKQALKDQYGMKLPFCR